MNKFVLFNLQNFVMRGFLLLLLLILFNNLFAQPPHDEPCGAINVPVIQSVAPCTPEFTSTAGVTYNNLAFPAAPCSYTYPDVWYKFTATTYTANMYADVSGGNGGSAYFIYTAPVCNGTLTYVSCGVATYKTPVALTNLIIGTTYYIRICINASFVVNFGLCIYTGFASVGINVTNPLQPLDVSGNVSLRNKLGIGESNPYHPLTFASVQGEKISLFGNNDTNYGLGVQYSTLQIHTDGPSSGIGFGYTQDAGFYERARIINNGELGMSLIGRLKLYAGTNSAGLWLANSTTNASFVGLAGEELVGFYGATGTGWGLTMNTTNGNVGIGLGSNSAQVPLQFGNSLGLTKISLYRGTYGDVGLGVYGGELRLQNDIPNGKVSLGVLETTGDYTELAKAQRNGAYAFSIFGSLWANGTTYASDERFKQNITAIKSPLQKLMQLNGVEYEMKTSAFAKNHFTPGRQMGLIAQNVEKIIPEAVSEMDGYKGVDYARLVPLLIESIKELQKEIEELKAKMK